MTDRPTEPTRPYRDCPECAHEYQQHADLSGCHGDANTCPCSESKATLMEDL